MIGVLIVAHAPLASALAAAGSHVYACAPERAAGQLAVIDVEPDTPVEATLLRARELVQQIDQGAGVLVLVDAFGATPGNIATRLAEAGRVAVVAGANLPMLLRTLCYRDGSLADTVEKALAGGTQGVLRVAGTPVQQQGVARSPAKADDLARLHHQQ